jgi:CRP-like cAMP-binding protein
METMYDTMLKLPLFQGLAKDELTGILGKVKLHFTKLKPGDTILRAGQSCDKLVFVLSGEVASSTSPADQSYTITEIFHAPWLIEQQALFGLNTSYASTHVAHTHVTLLVVSKSFVLEELSQYPIFRLNYVNLLSHRAQWLYSKDWHSAPTDIVGRLKDFIRLHVERLSGEKMVRIKMKHLGVIINETRLSVSRTLNDMERRGEIVLHRGGFIIPDAEVFFAK